MAERYKVFIAPSLLEQLQELGLVDQARIAVRDAMSDPERAGKQLTGALFPYRRLKLGRYRIIYRIVPDADPPQVLFLFCAIRKEGSKADVYRRLQRVLKRGELE